MEIPTSKDSQTLSAVTAGIPWLWASAGQALSPGDKPNALVDERNKAARQACSRSKAIGWIPRPSSSTRPSASLKPRSTALHATSLRFTVEMIAGSANRLSSTSSPPDYLQRYVSTAEVECVATHSCAASCRRSAINSSAIETPCLPGNFIRAIS